MATSTQLVHVQKSCVFENLILPKQGEIYQYYFTPFFEYFIPWYVEVDEILLDFETDVEYVVFHHYIHGRRVILRIDEFHKRTTRI